MQKNYTIAITDLIASGMPVETALQNMRSVMKRRGHLALYGTVLRNVITELAVIQKNTLPTITIAKAEDATSDKVQAALVKLGGGDSIKTVVDTTIIGGAIITHEHRQLDMSYKSKLKTLYQSVIS